MEGSAWMHSFLSCYELTLHSDVSCGLLSSGDAAVPPCVLWLHTVNGQLSCLSFHLHLELPWAHLFRQRLSISLPLHLDPSLRQLAAQAHAVPFLSILTLQAHFKCSRNGFGDKRAVYRRFTGG